MGKFEDIIDTSHIGCDIRTFAKFDSDELAKYPKVEIDLPVSGFGRILIDGHALPITDIKIGRALDELTEVTVTFYANVMGFKETV